MAYDENMFVGVNCGTPDNDSALSHCNVLYDDGTEDGYTLHDRILDEEGHLRVIQNYVDSGDSIGFTLPNGLVLTLPKPDVVAAVHRAIRDQVGETKPYFADTPSGWLADYLRNDPAMKESILLKAIEGMAAEEHLSPEETIRLKEGLLNPKREPKTQVSYPKVLEEIKKGNGVCVGCVFQAVLLCPLDESSQIKHGQGVIPSA